MTKTKKKLSKTAKAALKILEDSKLLATTKTLNAAKTEQIYKSPESTAKTAAPNKMRPSKKRG